MSNITNSAQWEFAIEFRVNQNTQQEYGPYKVCWDNGKTPLIYRFSIEQIVTDNRITLTILKDLTELHPDDPADSDYDAEIYVNSKGVSNESEV